MDGAHANVAPRFGFHLFRGLTEPVRTRIESTSVLKKELEDRLASAAAGGSAAWPAVIADLGSLTETEVKQDGERFLLRSEPRPAASLALSALGVLRLRQIRERLILHCPSVLWRHAGATARFCLRDQKLGSGRCRRSVQAYSSSSPGSGSAPPPGMT